jgi:hypothetical protein
VHVRRRCHRVLAGSDRPHGLALRNARRVGHARLAELQERYGVAVERSDGDRPAASRKAADERHRAGGRCPDDGSDVPADVDPAVLTARVRVVAEREGP